MPADRTAVPSGRLLPALGLTLDDSTTSALETSFATPRNPAVGPSLCERLQRDPIDHALSGGFSAYPRRIN